MILPSCQRYKLDEAIQKLGNQFEKLLKVIRAKAQVALEDLDDYAIDFERRDILRQIEKLTFKEIIDSWITCNNIFK